MSLINNMLKDLEKRELAPRNIPFAPFDPGTSSRIRRHINKKSYFFAGIFLLFVLGAMVILLNRKQEVRVASIPQPASMVEKPIVQVANNNAQWLKPVTVTGITLQVKGDITEISFLLDHAVLYRLFSDGMHNRLSLILDNTQLQAELPPVRYLHTAIQKLSTEKINGHTKFDLYISPDATVKYVSLNDENSKPELVVAIESHSNTVKQALSSSNDFAKTPALQTLLLQQYQSAIGAAEIGRYNFAIEQLVSILKADPSYRDARVSLVALLMDRGSTSRARRLIDEGLSLLSDYAPFLELKARILAQEGQVAQAILLLQQASPPLAENPDYYALIAALYEQINKNVLAIKLYRELLSVNAHNGSWWFGLGVALDKSGNLKDAVQSYTRAITEGHLNSASIAYLQNRLQVIQEDNNAKG